MKKALSIVLVLAMLASMAIYLPLGISATEPEQTSQDSNVIYEDNFDDYAAGAYDTSALPTRRS